MNYVVYTHLVALDLTGVVETTDRAIVALASSTKRLQGINLGGCKKLTNQAIQALAANCPLLRRVKLGGLEQITDDAVSALAKSCPLLLEIDLTHCKQITDVSVRDLWTFSFNMREMRLSHCSELTDAAFPAPQRSEVLIDGPNPFPLSNALRNERLPPLRVTKRFDHLRLLDLTACSGITDDAIEGTVSVAPKIRNLVLAKCTLITDHAVESICNLGKNLHYLHLGHASNITDRSIRTLARSCTRLRYIDLASKFSSSTYMHVLIATLQTAWNSQTCLSSSCPDCQSFDVSDLFVSVTLLTKRSMHWVKDIQLWNVYICHTAIKSRFLLCISFCRSFLSLRISVLPASQHSGARNCSNSAVNLHWYVYLACPLESLILRCRFFHRSLTLLNGRHFASTLAKASRTSGTTCQICTTPSQTTVRTRAVRSTSTSLKTHTGSRIPPLWRL